MERLTHKRENGIKRGYWSPNKKQELVDRLAMYEDREDAMVAAGSQRLQIQDSITVPEEQGGIRAYSLRI